jgi:NADH-quinone oxidoreductase subunit L
MQDLLAIKLAWLIPLLPLIGAAIAGFTGPRWLKGRSHWPIWIGVGGAAVLSLMLLFGMLGLWHQGNSGTALSLSQHWYTWIEAGQEHESGHFIVDAGAWFDPLTAVMLCVVTGIGLFITVYAAGYMHGEAGYFRFFAYLGLFIFAMTILVMANNFVLLYLGWEGVGLCSYLLIGYYYERPAAREAAKKAFLVNRVGDFGFGLGIMLIFLAFGSISFFGDPSTGSAPVLSLAAHPESLTGFQTTALEIVPFLLMLGAFGKSAQFPLYVWLPDAMEGPTPVSALIHAATMVTAGVYMIVRCGTLFVGNADAMSTIAAIGCFTALLAACIAMRQFDLKKVFAYSTISQLGYMFIGVGVLAPTAAVFHLVTHAFFKALLFLCSGVVMHAMLGHLDMRRMSGLKAVLPKTRWFILAGCAALAGFPFTSGFFSKDEIVGEAFHHHWMIGLIALITAFMTAYYTFRLYFRVFEGPLVTPDEPQAAASAGPADSSSHADSAHGTDTHDTAAQAAGTDAAPDHGTTDHGHDEHAASGHGHDDAHGGHHSHEPNIMMIPLAVLTIGALFAGLLNWPGEGLSRFLGQSPSLSDSFAVATAAAPISLTAADPYVDPKLFGQPQPTPRDEGGVPMPMLFGGAASILGILLAYWLHLRDRAEAGKIAARFPAIVRVLDGKFWVDEIFHDLIVSPLHELGHAFFTIDWLGIDGLVTMISMAPLVPGFILKFATQRGYLQGYATIMILGVAAILILLFVRF